MKHTLKLWTWTMLSVLCVGFSSCVKEEDENEKNDMEIEKFSKQLVGKWKRYAYYYDGWNGIDNSVYIQFNSDGSFSSNYTAYNYKTWEITGRGTSSNNYGRTYIFELKGSPDGNDQDWEIFLSDKPYGWDMEEYEYPDILGVVTELHQYSRISEYLYVRVK